MKVSVDADRSPAPSLAERALPLLQELGLTERKADVLALMMQGKSNKAICRALNLAEPTVKKHVTAILKALNVGTRTEAVIAVGKLSAAKAEQTTPRVESAHWKGLPDKPSIVVLPFANLSGDASQDYFAEGIVEDISIALGRFSWLFVIASSAVSLYKGRTLDLRQVGMELGVRYALCGSIRKDSSRVRIVVQLADTSLGGHLWADRMEGKLDNIFEMQDRVASQVAAAITPTLWSVEIKRAQHKPTESLDAYDLYLRALPRYRTSLAESRQALKLLNKAIEIELIVQHCLWVGRTLLSVSENVRLGAASRSPAQRGYQARASCIRDRQQRFRSTMDGRIHPRAGRRRGRPWPCVDREIGFAQPQFRKCVDCMLLCSHLPRR